MILTKNTKNIDGIEIIFLAGFLHLSCTFLEISDNHPYNYGMERLLPFHSEYKRLRNLITYLASHPGEEDWFDFKMNNGNPAEIGEYISALSNAATLCNHQNGYLIWGVDDQTHELRGTTFNPSVAKKGNEELENYLTRMTTPSLALVFYALEIEGKDFVVLQIPKAKRMPTAFAGFSSIRVGSNSHPLSKYPEKEMKLWIAMSSSSFESEVCKEELEPQEVLELLDFSCYYSRRKLPIPTDLNNVIDTFLKERFLLRSDFGKLSITNLGAILFAKDLYDYPNLNAKAVRVIRYKAKSRVEAISESEFHQGYAVMFDELVRYIHGLQSQFEEIRIGRESVGAFPDFVIREALANALVHQDLLDRSVNPMVELFPGSIEFSNPGKLLVDISRTIDTTPVCRNEMLARSLRLLRIKEDRDSGFDRIEAGLSLLHVPSALVKTDEFHSRIILTYRDRFSSFTEEEALRTVYSYCCYGFVNLDEKMGNAYFRKRFGLGEKDAPVISRLLSKAVMEKRIKLSSDSTGVKNRFYLPYWA